MSAEWLTLGILSGIDWPPDQTPFWAPRWALRLLVGAVLTAVTQLLLALLGIGFGSIPVVLAAAAILAAALRALSEFLSAPNPQRHSLGAGAAARQLPPATGPGASPARMPTGIIPGAPMGATLRQWPDDRAPMPAGTAARVTFGACERAAWLLLGAVLLAATLRSLLVPEAGWDAFSHWGLRAQAFALARTLVDAHSEHEYYPPLVPLLEAWLYLHRGAVSIDLGKTVWAVLGSAFAICLAWHLRSCLRPPWFAPAVATLIVASTPELLENFWSGQADLALTAFLSLTTLALLQAQRSPRPAVWLKQAAVFAAAAALTKFEGVPRLAVVLAALVVDDLLARRQLARPAFISALALFAAAACASLLWLAFEASHGITANAEHFGQFQPLAIGTVLATLLSIFAGARTGGGVLVAILGWAVAGRHLFDPPQRLLTLVVLGQLAATLLAFLVSDTSPDVAVRTSATRLFEQFLPLALTAAALGLTSLRPVPPERDL